MDQPVRPRLRPVLKLVESCNLACRYCYQEGRLDAGRFMAEATLDRVLEQLAACTAGPMHLLWFGGEPTLAGLRRFRLAVERAEEVFAGRGVHHGLQTNATLIDEEWAALLARHRFAVTVSLDGPEWLHDRQRPERRAGGAQRSAGSAGRAPLGFAPVGRGRGSHEATVRGIRALKAAGIEPRASAVLTPCSLPHPEDLVDYFAGCGVREVDFVPSTRFTGSGFEVEVGTRAYGEFMLRVMDRWLALGRSDFRIRFLAELARKMAGGSPIYCKLEGACSHYVTFGWNGDVFPCDEFSGVPGYRLGNVLEQPLAEILSAPEARAHFREWGAVPEKCRSCRWVGLCRGGCPWERRLAGALENPSILCEALQIVYDRMAEEIPGAAERWAPAALTRG